MKTRTIGIILIVLAAMITASGAIQYRNVDTEILPAGTLVSIGLPPNDGWARIQSVTINFQGNITLPDGRIVSSADSSQVYVVRMP